MFRRVCLVAVAGLAWTACRPSPHRGLAVEDIAGRWTIDFVRYTSATGATHYLGTESGDTLTIFADGRWLTHRTSTRFAMRHDSLVFPAQDGNTAFAVRTIGPGEPRLSLRRHALYDFNADGLAEPAVREMVFRRIGPGTGSRTR